MKLNHEQSALLDEIAEAHAAFKAAEIRELAIARREARERILGFQVARDRLVAKAHLAGVPKSRIGKQGLRSTDPKTYNKAIENGMRFINVDPISEVKGVTFAPSGDRFQSYAPNTVMVTLTPEEFEPYAGALAAGVPDEAQDHVFELREGALIPANAEDDATWQHPVVQVVMNTSLKAEALAFLDEQEAAA